MPGYQELLLILVVILILFGGKKIPELLRGVGRGMGELQKGLEEGKRGLSMPSSEQVKERDSSSE